MAVKQITTNENETRITPLYHHSGYAQVLARLEALQQRLAVIKEEARRPRGDQLDELIARLTGDPNAALSAAEPTADQSQQIRALEAAIVAVQNEAHQLRSELSRELASRMRPERVTRGRQIVAAMERVLELAAEDVAVFRRVVDLGYDSPQQLLPPVDREALERALDRVRGRVGG